MGELTLAAANTIVQAGLAEARASGCEPLAVAVLDAGGHLKCLQREDGAGFLRPEIAIGKAWGALGMGFGSRTLARRAEAGDRSRVFLAALNAASGGKVVPAAGGVLIRDSDGEIVGAVGISGDRSEKDEACAVAGIEAAGFAADVG